MKSAEIIVTIAFLAVFILLSYLMFKDTPEQTKPESELSSEVKRLLVNPKFGHKVEYLDTIFKVGDTVWVDSEPFRIQR